MKKIFLAAIPLYALADFALILSDRISGWNNGPNHLADYSFIPSLIAFLIQPWVLFIGWLSNQLGIGIFSVTSPAFAGVSLWPVLFLALSSSTILVAILKSASLLIPTLFHPPRWVWIGYCSMLLLFAVVSAYMVHGVLVFVPPPSAG